MSVRSRRRRKAKRGGILGHLELVCKGFPITPLTTPDERFADAAHRAGMVYAHPDDAGRIQDAFEAEGLLLDVVSHPMVQRGHILAVPPSEPWAPPNYLGHTT